MQKAVQAVDIRGRILYYSIILLNSIFKNAFVIRQSICSVLSVVDLFARTASIHGNCFLIVITGTGNLS